MRRSGEVLRKRVMETSERWDSERQTGVRSGDTSGKLVEQDSDTFDSSEGGRPWLGSGRHPKVSWSHSR